jgi:hypothetical protein
VRYESEGRLGHALYDHGIGARNGNLVGSLAFTNDGYASRVLLVGLRPLVRNLGQRMKPYHQIEAHADGSRLVHYDYRSAYPKDDMKNESRTDAQGNVTLPKWSPTPEQMKAYKEKEVLMAIANMQVRGFDANACLHSHTTLSDALHKLGCYEEAGKMQPEKPPYRSEHDAPRHKFSAVPNSEYGRRVRPKAGAR